MPARKAPRCQQREVPQTPCCANIGKPNFRLRIGPRSDPQADQCKLMEVLPSGGGIVPQSAQFKIDPVFGKRVEARTRI